MEREVDKMYKNLQAEFARQNIKPFAGIVKALGCTEKTARNKLKGITAITITEAMKIAAEFFPDDTLEYLFATE